MTKVTIYNWESEPEVDSVLLKLGLPRNEPCEVAMPVTTLVATLWENGLNVFLARSPHIEIDMMVLGRMTVLVEVLE